MSFSVKQIKAICAQALDQMVHPSVGFDQAARSSHKQIIGFCLLVGAMPILAWPFLLAIKNGLALSLAEPMIAQSCTLLAAFVLSRTGSMRATFAIASASTIAAISGFALAVPILQPIVVTILGLLATNAFLSQKAENAFISLILAGLGLTAISTMGDAIVNLGALNVIASTLILAAYAISLRRSLATGDPKRSNRSDEDIFCENAGFLLTRHNRNGKTLASTDASIDLIGQNSGTVLDAGLDHFVHVSDRVHFFGLIADCVDIGEDRTTELLFVHRDGQRVPVELLARPFLNAETGDMEVVITSHDISHRRVRQNQLEQAQEKAESASVAKSHFLATMSHELRTPLNAILGFSDLMRQEIAGPLNEKQIDYLNDVHHSGEHLLRIVNDILDVSKIEAGHYQLNFDEFDIEPILETAVSIVKASLPEKAIDFVIDVQPDLGPVLADPNAVKQVLINLLSNAAKFSHQNGKVILTAERHYRGYVFAVSDDGIGMSAADCKAMCEPFTQVSNSYNKHVNGTGLGLSIVKGFTELHGGEMKVTSSLGAGTKVTIQLPGIDLANKPETPSEPVVVTKFPDVHASDNCRELSAELATESIAQIGVTR